MYPSKFLIFVISELLSAKIEESKSNQILSLYIYRERERDRDRERERETITYFRNLWFKKKCKLIPCII